MTPVRRAATADDIMTFYGEAQPNTVRAWVWDLDGEPIAIAGAAYFRAPSMPTLFSRMRPEARRFPRKIVREARRVLSVLVDCPMLAFADVDEPGSVRFLLHLGFTLLYDRPSGGVYRFVPERITP